MAHQIIATSVPRGLDGVSGYQTVLKSSGIPPRVFDRLKARSGYSHPYSHGDSRNPVIYVHRIEELGGSRWHVLGCIRDAGSDHTGRSNFLAHMLAIDAAEARGKPGGPAAAAMARGCFLETWSRPPDPAAPSKTLVAADRPTQPGDANAWTAAGLDPGLAGDLAAAAMAGQKVVLVARPDDDVLALFADSLRLVEPSKRWGVTFNTCAIEDFDGVWRAIRADLGDARDLRDGKASLIDLTKNPRGSTNPYAQFARGESTTLPWQKPIASVRPEQEIPESSNKATPQTAQPSAARGDPRKVPPKQSGRATTRASRDRRPRYEESDSPRVPWHAIAIGGLSLLAISGLVAIPYRDQIFDLIREPGQRSHVPNPELRPVAPVTPPLTDGKETREWRGLEEKKNARNRLAAGAEGKTHTDLRDEANKLLEIIQDLRSGKSGEPKLELKANDGTEQDPEDGVNSVLEVCDSVRDVLQKPLDALRIEEVQNTESKLIKAVADLGSLRNQVRLLASEERKKQKNQRAEIQEKDDKTRRQQAFAGFQSMSKTVGLPFEAARTDILGDNDTTEAKTLGTIDLGPFSFAYLAKPKFWLAVPRDQVGGQFFKADIVKEEGAEEPRWDIRYVPSDVGADADQAKPRTLAHLVARQGTLILDVPRSNEIKQSPFAMLRRSVILVEAKDPAAPDGQAVVQEIRLLEPIKAKPLVIDLLSERQQVLRFLLPPGQFGSRKLQDGSVASLKLPICSLRFEAEMPDRTMEKFELFDDGKDDARLGIKEWRIPLATVPLSKVNPKLSDLGILAVIRLSLPQAIITVHTELNGDLAKKFSKDEIKQVFINSPEKGLKKNQARFATFVKEGKGFEFIPDAISQRGENEKIEKWFGKELVGERSKGWGLVMPGHETIKSSFTMFLKDTGPDKRNTFEDFEADCKQVRTQEQWKAEFLDRVDKWSEWFKPQFETQWHEYVRLFRGTLAEAPTLKIIAISSLAFDESGKEYVVPLVIGEVFPEVDQADMPTETKTTPGPDDAPASADDRVVPTPSATEKSSVGIE